MPNTTEIDEGEIAKLVSDGGLKPETLARRKRVRAAFQAFTLEHYEKDVTELINGPKEELSKAVITRHYIPLRTMCQQTKPVAIAEHFGLLQNQL